MKKLYAIILSLGIIGMSSCDYLAKDISEDMNFTINGDLFKNTVQIEVVDAATGQAIPSLKGIYIEGPNSDVIYSQTGKKNPEYTNGIISLGVDPKYLFNDDNPVEFDVAVNAAGYVPSMETVIIYPNQFNQKIKLEMYSLTNSPSYMEVEVKDFALNNGVMISDGIVKKTGGPDTVYYDDGFTTVGIPVGTQFSYYEEKTTGKIVSSLFSLKDATILVPDNNFQKDFIISPYTIDKNKISAGYTKKNYSGSVVRSVFYYNVNPHLDLTISRTAFLFLKRHFSADIVTTLIGKDKGMSIFKSACIKPLIHSEFYGVGPDGKEFQIFADPVFYSFVLDPNTINPKTNLPIKEGDEIESATETVLGDGKIEKLPGSIDLSNVFNDIDLFSEFPVFPVLPTSDKVEYIQIPYTKQFIIKKDVNGKLRAQSSSNTAGYFVSGYNLRRGLSFDADMEWQIPDVENLTVNTFFEVNGFKIPIKFIRDFKRSNYIDIELYSPNPITSYKFVVDMIYFNQSLLNNFNVEDFNFNRNELDLINNNLPPTVFFDITLICKGGIKVRPSIFTKVYVPSENAYYYANIKNGQWATRGIELNKEIKLDFTYDNIKIDTTVVLKSSKVKIEKEVNSSQFCQ